jgi:hypothetical protein
VGGSNVVLSGEHASGLALSNVLKNVARNGSGIPGVIQSQVMVNGSSHVVRWDKLRTQVRVHKCSEAKEVTR